MEHVREEALNHIGFTGGFMFHLVEHVREEALNHIGCTGVFMFHLVEHVREEEDEAVPNGCYISILVPHHPLALVNSKCPPVGWLPTSIHIVDCRYPP